MQNIILIGMSGVGKSTLGLELSKKLGYLFLDTDREMEKVFGDTIQNLLKQKGEDFFMKFEEKIICDLKLNKYTVVATGGSVVYSENSIKHLKSLGGIYFLYLPIEKIVQRIDVKSRGIIKMNNRSYDEVYLEREALYKKYAGKVIFLDGDLEKDLEIILRII